MQEAQNKTIVLVVGQDFEAADVDGMLKYLYTGVLQPRQKQDSLKAFVVAEYFKVKSLRSAALDALRHQIGEFIGISYWRNYHKLAGRCPLPFFFFSFSQLQNTDHEVDCSPDPLRLPGK